MHDIDTGREPKDVGRLVGIFIAPERGAPPVARDAATAVVGRGLAGDRYYHGTGTFSARAGLFAGARELSLIDAAAVERCNARLRAAGARGWVRVTCVAISSSPGSICGRTAAVRW
ncbi:hypothetical protein [Salinisphaera orenii]|uniref:hypothetical protein n=1 Tax=Salinisphaera orenii TaxID=856731 RepID=UPI000F4CBC85|nr:hypothetical protein [Salinisphaera orenii]